MPKAPDSLSRVECEAAGHPQEEPAAADGRAQLRPAHTDERGAPVRLPHGQLTVPGRTSLPAPLPTQPQAAQAHGRPRVLRQNVRPPLPQPVRPLRLRLRPVRHLPQVLHAKELRLPLAQVRVQHSPLGLRLRELARLLEASQQLRWPRRDHTRPER